ncbi:MAG TPA: superoxide dismutase [Candidatus Acidoferrales bacterium]|nr:superoxide dismutase [Candidatus Acidoferrales bacterium]
MRHALAPLPYNYTALQPWIDEHTMHIHYDCHHQACVDALNRVEARLAAARPPAAPQTDFLLIRYLQELAAVYAAEHLLHCLYWENMGPGQGGQPRDELADQIAQDFGSFAAFKSQFYGAATSLDAGGWAALVWQADRRQLAIVATESPRPHAATAGGALLVLDMCEHAYYLRYQNRRGEYAYNWWNIVNWSCVARRFAAATSPRPRATASRAAQPFASGRRYRDVPTTTAGHEDSEPRVLEPAPAAGVR